jgi:hypothetical protein
LGHICELLSTILLKSRPARNSLLSLPTGGFLAVFGPDARAGARSLSPSPAGTLTLVSHSGHFTAFPRAASGAFSTLSQVGHRTLTAIRTFFDDISDFSNPSNQFINSTTQSTPETGAGEDEKGKGVTVPNDRFSWHDRLVDGPGFL